MAKDEKPKENPDDLKAALIKEATSFGLEIPRISIAGFNAKKPEDLIREKARVKKQLIELLTFMIAKAKALAKLKPIEKRMVLLAARFKAVKSRTRAHTYSDKNIAAWLEEYNLIKDNPKSWNKITANGTKPYTPGNKRKMTAKDRLDAMDLDD